jgi:16S rRNA (adenine(1408)-N(1))-methyltransferase
VTLTRVIGKDRTEPMTAEELATRRVAATHTVIDVGTGDGRYAYALAGEHADWLVLGIDALDEPMEEVAHRAGRKPAKGGRPNVVLLRASIEALPVELHGIADEVRVLLPWGNLLEGIVLGHDDVVRGLAALGPRIEVVLNGEIWEESTPARFAHLPVPTPEHIAAVVAPAFARAGVTIGAAHFLDAPAAKALPTTWARRLGHAREHPKFLRFTGARLT